MFLWSIWPIHYNSRNFSMCNFFSVLTNSWFIYIKHPEYFHDAELGNDHNKIIASDIQHNYIMHAIRALWLQLVIYHIKPYLHSAKCWKCFISSAYKHNFLPMSAREILINQYEKYHEPPSSNFIPLFNEYDYTSCWEWSKSMSIKWA